MELARYAYAHIRYAYAYVRYAYAYVGYAYAGIFPGDAWELAFKVLDDTGMHATYTLHTLRIRYIR